MLDEQVEQEHLGRVGLDPAPGERLALLLEVDDAREVDAGVGVQRAARLDLERDAGERHAAREAGAQPGGERLPRRPRPTERAARRRRRRGSTCWGRAAPRSHRRGRARAAASRPRRRRARRSSRRRCAAYARQVARSARWRPRCDISPSDRRAPARRRPRGPRRRARRSGCPACTPARSHRPRRLREVGGLLQLEIARAHAEAHLRAAAESARDRAHQLDLPHAVERDARADADGALEQRARLAGAVDRDQLRRHAARERRVQLGRAEHVAAEALLRQRAAQRERGVGLDRRQDARLALGPGGLQRTREAARVAAQLILGDDRERRAEALGERGRVAALDLQPPVRRSRGSRRCAAAVAGTRRLYEISYRGSFAALTRRWSDGRIRSNERKRYATMNVIRTPAGKLRRRAAIGVVGLAALGGGGAAIAASKSAPASAQAQTQSIVSDAAGQLGVTPAALTAAIKKAMVDQIEAQVTAGTLTKAQAVDHGGARQPGRRAAVRARRRTRRAARRRSSRRPRRRPRVVRRRGELHRRDDERAAHPARRRQVAGDDRDRQRQDRRRAQGRAHRRRQAGSRRRRRAPGG